MAPLPPRPKRFIAAKLIAAALLALPAAWIAWRWAEDALGLRILRLVLFDSGVWSARFLILSLLIGPLFQALRWPALLMVRRQVGIAAFLYAAAHFVAYAVGQGWNWSEIAEAILRFIYLLIGTVALLAMALMASTSHDWAQRKLGKAWHLIHRQAYGVTALVIAHDLLANRARAGEAMILSGLLLWTLIWRRLPREANAAPRLSAMLLLALVAGLTTMAGEFAWYALATGIDPLKVLAANITLAAGLRPAWWVLGFGLGVAVGARLCRRVSRPPAP